VDRPVLDLACGHGRHALAVARAGLTAIGLDRDPMALSKLQIRASQESLPVLPVVADLEAGRGIPVNSMSCGGILVFRFLYRPLATAIVEALAPGGLLLYETFTVDQAKVDYGPRNTAFLLQHDELPTLFPDLEVLSYWEGWTAGDRPIALARLVARRALG
jgi:SAM-dependent methyltransferase